MIFSDNGLEYIKTKYGLLRHCDTVSTDIIGNRIKTIMVELHCDDSDIECLYIPFLNESKNYNNIFGYYLSIYSPEYIVEPKVKLTHNEKVELMNLLNNGGWNKIINTFKNECDNCFSKDCIHKNRVLPKYAPNYIELI